MVKLDVTLLRYLSPDDFRILTAVEMGMKNHELVPGLLINSIATLKFGGGGKILVDLTKHKLLAYERGKRYDGYRLTYHGYDYLSLNTLTARGIISGVGNQIGVGKESDVFIGQSADESQQRYALKFHRLGRVCFRRVSEKRDYYTKSKCKTNWIYLSRRAAQREYEFLMYMYSKKLPVPKPIDHNRHVVVMELIDGTLLNHITLDYFETESRELKIEKLYNNLMDLILRFANETRVIHGDFNEFNILIKNQKPNEDGKYDENQDLEPIIIDLPQMIGVEHDLAPEYFDRDVQCIVDFFVKRFHYTSDRVPTWDDVDMHTKLPENEPNPMENFLNDVLNNQERNKEYQEHKEENELDNIEENVETNKSQFKVDRNLYEKLIDQEEQPHDKNDENEEEDSEDDSDANKKSREKDLKDLDDCLSQFTAITVTPDEARRKLRAEITKKELNRKKRDAAKPKNIKGDANPVKRKRKTNNTIACEDLETFFAV